MARKWIAQNPRATTAAGIPMESPEVTEARYNAKKAETGYKSRKELLAEMPFSARARFNPKNIRKGFPSLRIPCGRRCEETRAHQDTATFLASRYNDDEVNARVAEIERRPESVGIEAATREVTKITEQQNKQAELDALNSHLAKLKAQAAKGKKRQKADRRAAA
jgi:hypothetical protein